MNAFLNIALWAPPLLYPSPGPDKTHSDPEPIRQGFDALCIISCCCVTNHP